MMIATGLFLTVVFVSIATLAASFTRDKAKGIGLSILLWLCFSLIFDALLLFLLFQFQDYPLEKAMVIFSFLNPIDLSRIQILLQLDISALMGYTGAVFREFFGNTTGIILSFSGLTVWVIVPLLISLKKFNRKDLITYNFYPYLKKLPHLVFRKSSKEMSSCLIKPFAGNHP